MEWVLIALIVIAGLWFVRTRNLRQVADRRQRERAEEDLAAVRRAADEDVTQFGEELQRLDIDLAGRELDEGMRSDYQRALDDYEAAKESVDALTEPEQVRHVSEILEDGRYAVACVHARVAGEPLPQRRAPCFFNPQHGPSVRDVSWTPSGGAARDVPACALDAERVEAGAEPDSRQVMVGSRRMPYWQAGPAFSPWAAGYFAPYAMMNVLFLGTLMGGGFGYDGGDSGSGDSGSDGGGDAGAGDGGGESYDASGDYGGGDYGGGDFGGFGGGDFGGGFDGGGGF